VKERTTGDWGRPIDIGNGIETQKDKQKRGGYMLQINRNNGTLTPGGEEQMAILVFCK